MQHNHKTSHSVFRKNQARKSQVSEEEKKLHHKSKQLYPELSLSPGEYVLEAVRRHPVGLVAIWSVTLIISLLAIMLIFFYDFYKDDLISNMGINPASLPSSSMLILPAFILAIFFIAGGFIATYVYNKNRFYLTTESVIQFVQYSLFNSKQQIVNLINVEDVSADRRGILQHILNYGTLRLSTQGEETIYRFQLVSDPSGVVSRINDATEIAVQQLEGKNYPKTEF